MSKVMNRRVNMAVTYPLDNSEVEYYPFKYPKS